ncbi:MAG: phosphatase [Veillonella sp.]|uniref:Ppx/GppA phosphatase family protein n=1 Tax=Veillonella sp. TaxID=1926307 RepID=UPI002912C526|nr:phosphatase [Veillonella sp.]MDU3384100.1 phosphatase [Veillonella sp.]
MTLPKALRYAVLHVGSSSMSITILEYKGIDDVRVIDYAAREVTFGEELFQTSRLSFETIEEICHILKGYKQLMADYGVSRSRLYGTTVIREAANRRSILDQIYIQTGMRVEVIDMPKEVYYKYALLYYKMTNQYRLTDPTKATLFLDITSGGVGLTVWRGESLLFQRNMHSGSLRVMESFNRNQRSSTSFPMAIDIITIEPERFKGFIKSFDGVTATKLINRYKLPEYKANILMPTMILFNEIITAIEPKSLIFSSFSFSQGISWFYGVEAENNPFMYQLREQNAQLARAVAARYHTDSIHDAEVERFSSLFCKTLRHKGLPERWGYLCRIAAILCSVGKFVNLRNHGEHAYHIVMGTDIFGLSEEEKQVVANVVFYHYKGTPSDDDTYFNSLTELQKIQVTKLVAIIRVACALDAGSNQKISDVILEERDNVLYVFCRTNEDISLEWWTFNRDAEYFTEVFGMELMLVRGGDRHVQ